MSYYPPKDELFEPEVEIDLHGCTTFEAQDILEETIESGIYSTVRIIVGKGRHSELGPVLPVFVGNYLRKRNISFVHAPQRAGGTGAYDVTL